MQQTAPPSDRPDALARLTLLGYGGGMAAIAAGIVAAFFALGYFVVYWRSADMDLVLVYDALRINAGHSQSYFDHPGLVTIHSLALWFRALHALGLLDIASFAQLPPASAPEAFNAAMTALVRAGRVYSLLIGGALLAAMAYLFRRIVDDWRIALLGTFALAFSGGLVDHLRIMRTELLSAGFVIVALLLLIVAARHRGRTSVLLCGIAAALAALGLVNKVQAIVLIAALPLVVLPFGTRAMPPDAARAGTGTAIAAWLVAALALIAIAPLVQTGFDAQTMARAGLPRVFGGYAGFYQAALALWTLGLLAIFAAIWRVGLVAAIAAAGAIIAGGAIVLATLHIGFDARNVVAVFNPLEKMWSFATYAMADGTDPARYALTTLLADIGSVIARYTFVLHTSPRPSVFLVWLIVPGIVLAWRRGERQVAIQSLVLLGAALGIDALGVRRGLKLEYFLYTDPLIVLSAMLLIARMRDLARHRLAYPIGVALILVHVVLAHAEPVKRVVARAGPEGICVWNRAYMPALDLPFCPRAAAPGR